MRVWGPMWRAGVGLGVFVVAAGAGALVSCTLVPTLAHADTMRGALTQAYQNNPQLNAQRASVRATDEGVPQALSGYRPRISLSATVGEQFLELDFEKHVRHHRRHHLSAFDRQPRDADLRRDLHANAAQRLRDGVAHPAGGATGFFGARDAAAERADRAACGRDRLHESDPRRRDSQPAAQQRRGAAGAVAANPGSLPGRRGHPHRRGAVGVAACRGARADADRGVELHHVAFDLPAGDRRRAGPARAGEPGRPPGAGQSAAGHRAGAGAASDGDGCDVQRRRGGVSGQDRRKLALSDPQRGRARRRRPTAPRRR